MSASLQRTLLGELVACHDDALRRCGGTEVDLDIAGKAVRLRFAGCGMVGPTVAPLAARHFAAVENPALTVRVLDAATTNGSAPRQLAELGAFRLAHAVRANPDPDVWTDVHVDPLYSNQSHVAISAIARDTGEAVFWVTAAGDIPWWLTSAPLLAFIHSSLQDPGRTLVHAAGVGCAGRGVLVGGPGGSGKSTLAVGATLAGMQFVGDDYVVVDVEEPARIHNVYGNAKLLPVKAETWPELEALSVADFPIRDDGKRIIDLHSRFPDQIVASLSVEAVVIPRVVPGNGTRLFPISRREALQALAITTVMQLPPDGGRALGVLAQLVRSRPCWLMQLDGDPAKAVAALAQICETGGQW